MAVLKVASVCALMAPGDPAANFQTLERWGARAAEAGANLALFPETFLTGYPETEHWGKGPEGKPAFLACAEPIPGPSTDRLVDLARKLKVSLCAGILERKGQRLFNTQVIVTPGRGLLGVYRKVQVAAKESWFSEPGNEYPIFDVGDVPTGIMLCRDKSHPEIARILALEGAVLILNPHSTLGGEADRPGISFRDGLLRLCAARAMENGCYLIANNSILNCPIDPRRQAGYTFAFDPYGRVIHCDPPPGDAERMALITVDTEVVRQRRELEGEHFNLWSRIPSAYHRLVEAGDASGGATVRPAEHPAR